MTRVRLTLSLVSALALGACSLAPKYVAPTPPVPQTWPAGDAYLLQSEANLPVVSYTEVFRDPRLQQLIAQALENNRDLRVAAANLAAARAQVRVVRSDQFPAIGVSASATYANRGSSTTGNTGSGTGSGTGTTRSSGSGWSYGLQGGVSSFELDFFGRYANATESQRNTALATEATARTVRLGLIADLAQAWATYGSDVDLLRLAEATAANAQRSVELTSLRLNGGVAPRTDLRQAEQVLETARGDLAQQRTALAQDANIIRLLIGAEFDQALLPAGIAQVNNTLATLPAGTSSQVLLRRPDVVEAEYQLRAANADIGVARAQLFPSISLTGLLGVASSALSSLFSGGAFSWSAGADASYSLFNAGGRVANVEVSRAQRDAAVASYERAIQVAFREVSDALADQGTLAERLRAASANTAAAADTAKLTEARYRFGVDSFLASLDAQRSLYGAQQSEIATRLAQASNRVTLYRVLGGDAATATAALPSRR
ncbi:efflux transporter outer membrane subunit [Novosphingobium sp. 9U]|uniref:efflux transporter outer membrane subunit n=1 Tax=Novosphingobium sp. 9U TaxID=2653158 RepID=UPI0012F2162B|nr:efflux transporter outer membrane subunit [Novosphingobium sp. 9U]VWX54111.1 Outer membrane protein OprM [Novosphingobium sp. 9U]